MLIRAEMLPWFARAAVKRLRSEPELDLDERGAMLIEQQLEGLPRSGLTESGVREHACPSGQFRRGSPPRRATRGASRKGRRGSGQSCPPPAVWVPPGEPSLGPTPASAPARLGGELPTLQPQADGDDGFGLD